MSMEQFENKGPFVKKGDVVSDREIFAAEMTEETEIKFDKFMQIKAINKEAKKELAKRNVAVAFESLMESFK
jgi:hypothetical protein